MKKFYHRKRYNINMDFLQFIKNNLDKASGIAMNNFGKVSSTVKGGDTNAVLTKTDLEIGELIIKNIRDNFPEHNIINEETGVVDKKSSFTWVIDPIDGTSNFAAGLPFFGVMLALMKDEQPLFSGISLPYFKEVYLAEKTKGAFCNGEKVEVTKEDNLLKVLVGYGIDSHRENPELTKKEATIFGELVLNIRNVRTTNSCFDELMLARGKYGGWLNQTLCIWDLVPVQLIIEEAGGKVTDFFGNKIDYKNHLQRTKENFTICAAPEVLHNKLQKIIRNVK